MHSSHLTIKHRPQTFAQVVGQDAIKAVLSRAAAEDKVAPAYLFSGTRGVGKTTLARILAKALNCVHAPTAEPCNECVHCRQITKGACVDVVEIDAASNRGIDDARRLKEDIGYAPLECRYKVFIIDEAHMLTREAFNALLKTLEEPPARVTFILATTEPHKFPATIISRCQHYIFKRVGQSELEAHLLDVLGRESVEAEPEAVRLVARRGAGSVRDSMSLLSQVLALGQDRLLAQDVRRILGLAGPEVMLRVVEALAAQDPVAINEILGEILDQGLDLGYFLRELAGCWRTLFLLRQAGEKALPLLNLGEEEAARWLDWAPKFKLAHIHACWQMTLDGQQRVLKSLEPAMALELLLLNLAFLPSLIDLDDIGRGQPGRPGSGGAAGHSGPVGRPSRPGGAYSSAAPSGAGMTPPSARPPRSAAAPTAAGSGDAGAGEGRAPRGRVPARQAEPAAPSSEAPASRDAASAPAPAATPAPAPVAAPAPASAVSGPRDWANFLLYHETRSKETGRSVQGIKMAKGEVDGDAVVIRCISSMHHDRLTSQESLKALREYCAEFFGPAARLDVREPSTGPTKSGRELREEVGRNPLVQQLASELEGHLIEVAPAGILSPK